MTKETSGRSFRSGDIDRLVATYAPIGRQHKRRRRVRTVSAACGVTLFASAGAWLATTGSPSLDQLQERLRGLLPAMPRPEESAREMQGYPEQRDFALKIERLEQQIAAIQAEKRSLESQRSAIAEQSAMLDQLLQETNGKQAGLEARASQGSQLDHEIAAIAAQRQALEQRWTQFEAQGELLAMEIVAVNAQRKELANQRQQIERQREELAELMERADRLYRRNADATEVEAIQEPAPEATEASTFSTYTNNSLVVNNRELDTMRGGFRVGNGVDVSFGFAQTGSVNGVEQFTNSFSVKSLASGFQNSDMSNMNSVLLQNGGGNFVSAGVLDSLSESFGSIVQNTLDNQVISTTTIMDISLQNVPGSLQGMYGEQALTDSLGSF